MIYSIFVYSEASGLLMWDKHFEDISSGKMEMFSSFFSAIKSFIGEMIKGANELKSIQMGDYVINITSLKKIGVDLVFIADNDDEKKLKKIIPPISDILLQHKELFASWNGDRTIFSVLDQSIINIVSQNKNTKSQQSFLVDNQSEILRALWSNSKELDPKLKENLKKERDFLYKKIQDPTELSQKLANINKIMELDQQLMDQPSFLKDQQIQIKLEKEFQDAKLKLDFYLKQCKQTLSESLQKAGNVSLTKIDFRNSYIALYSFSTKLKFIGKINTAEIYRKVASSLMDTDKLADGELSETISYILKLPDDISYYLT
jgi:hypothetical protein